MSSLKIETNSGILDLLPGTDEQFYITRQIKDLSTLQEAKADFTKVISIPATANNETILGAKLIGSDSPTTKIVCSIYLNGLPIAPVATMLHVNTTVNNGIALFEIAILYGNFGLFDSILGGDLTTLNTADIAIDWDIPGVLAITDTTEDIVFAFTDNTGDEFHFLASPSKLNIYLSSFWFYTKSLVKRIINEAGYNLEVVSAPNDYNEAALFCPLNKYIDQTVYAEGVSLRGEVQNTGDREVNGTTAQVNFDDAILNVGGFYDVPNFQYDFTGLATPTTVTIVVSGDLRYIQGHPQNLPGEVRILLNGVSILTTTWPGDGLTVPFNMTVNQLVQDGDIVSVEIFADARQSANSTLAILAFSNFNIASQDQVDNTVIPSDWLPTINKKEFLSSVLSHFNLLPVTDDINKTVFLYSFNEIGAQPEQDWSNLLDESRPVNIEHSISGYAQNSHFKYLDDESLVRTDADYIKLFPNEVLELEADVLVMPYSACDVSLGSPSNEPITICRVPQLLTETELADSTVNIITFTGPEFEILDPNEAIDFQVGDYISAAPNSGSSIGQTGARRIIQKLSETQGVVADDFLVDETATLYSITRYESQDVNPKVALIKDGDPAVLYTIDRDFDELDTPVPNPKVATFADSLKWSEIINNGQYKGLINALETPQKVSAWFNIPISLFLATQLWRPVYIAKFSGFYYINRINQFKNTSQTKVDLIRISSTN